jgi:uncharacterized damage-inducible protein DinB
VDETQRIQDKLLVARRKLLEATASLTAEQWEWQPGDGRWSIRLTLAHVGSAQWSHLEVARSLAAGDEIEIPDFDLDAWNAAAVTQRLDWSVDQVLADLTLAQEATVAFLDELDTPTLERRGSHPALGEVTVGQVLRIMGLHDNLHRRDVLQLRQEMGNDSGA